jgi:endonuclease-3
MAVAGRKKTRSAKSAVSKAGASETPRQRKTRAGRIVRGLRELYSDADCALHHTDPLELLVATILSAQCTDERVNMVTPALFARYDDARAYAEADSAEVEELVRSTGFFRNKARSLIGLGKALTERHAGQVPDDMEALVKLPGVGRKTANVLLGTWFGQPAIPVDTHVVRLVRRMELSENSDPVKIEYDLQELLPSDDWTFASHALIWHGRRVCNARKPNCDGCSLRPDCPFEAP